MILFILPTKKSINRQHLCTPQEQPPWELRGPQSTAFMSGGFGYLLTATSFCLHSKVLQHQGREKGRKREGEKELEISQRVSVRTHQLQVMFRQRECQGATSSCSHRGQGRSLTVPMLTLHTTLHTVTAGESAVPLHRAACSLAESSRCGVELWKRPCLCLSRTCTERSCYGHGCEGEEGRRVEAQPLSPRVPSAMLHSTMRVSSVQVEKHEKATFRINFLFTKTSHDWK